MGKSRNHTHSDYDEEEYQTDRSEIQQRRKEKRIQSALKRLDIDALSEDDEDYF